MARDDGDRIGALLRAALRWEASAPFVSVPHMAIVGGRHVAMAPSGLVTARRGAHLTPRSAVAGGRRIYAPSWTFGSGAPPPPHGVRFVAGGRHALARFAASDRAQSADSTESSDGDEQEDGQWQPGRHADGRHRAVSTSSSSSSSSSTDGTTSDTDTDIATDDDSGSGSGSDQDDGDDDSSGSDSNRDGQRQSTDDDDESTASDDSDDGQDGPRHLTRLLNDAVTRSLDEVCASAPTPRRVLPDLPAHRHCTSQHGEGACAVCLDDFSDGDCVRALPCAHTYHAPCIDRWLVDHDACPCCRAAVVQHVSTDERPALAVVRPVDPAPMPAWMNDMLGCGP
ncbi:Ring finger protein [Pandoravirus dulcis]|uniref:Ring finger protein n=1 Tax=Pandoravirus dulcis TaxID=1349409 RepID=S4VW98_9VIRU|nr:Ring finger protein [Pandoravirus dulcis]AGO82356.2 Ring finger protein [Pandoravirus dulcis]